METKSKRRHNQKGNTKQKRRAATGEVRLWPIQSHASFIPEAEIHEG